MRRYYLSPWFVRVSLALVVGLTDCSKDNPQPSAIPSDFIEYVNRFVAEGKTRNVNVDIRSLKIEYVSQLILNGNHYCGQSVAGSTPLVQITNSAGCWTDQTDLNKEILLFHELGMHCLKEFILTSSMATDRGQA